MNEIEARLRRVTKDRNERESKASNAKYLQESLARLRKIVIKKMTTAFIGAMAKFETHIGTELWGHGLPAHKCTPDQLAWREVWQNCRNEILNHGNHQARSVEAELEQYTISWDRYQTKLGGRSSNVRE